MKLPFASWTRVIGALGFKLVRVPRKGRIARRRGDEVFLVEGLERRQMLAGDTGLVIQAD
jgi:hypothetical protein